MHDGMKRRKLLPWGWEAESVLGLPMLRKILPSVGKSRNNLLSPARGVTARLQAIGFGHHQNIFPPPKLLAEDMLEGWQQGQS